MKIALFLALLSATVMTAPAKWVDVPDGGSSMVLLGAGFAGITIFRRMLKK